MDNYNRYLEKCKSPKKASAIRNIVTHIIIGVRQELSSTALSEKLNRFGVYTLMKKRWTANSLQMQILKMARLDDDSSLAWGLASMVKERSVSEDDLQRLATRTRLTFS